MKQLISLNFKYYLKKKRNNMIHNAGYRSFNHEAKVVDWPSNGRSCSRKKCVPWSKLDVKFYSNTC